MISGVSSHFSCIGFPVADMAAYWALARRAAAEGTRLELADGAALVRWQVGGGPEIWAQVNARGEVMGATPFFATGTPHRVALTGLGEDPDAPLEGWVDGWMEPTEDDEPYSGAFPLRVTLVDFALARQRLARRGGVIGLEIAALAHEADLYADLAAYRSAPGDVYRPPAETFAATAHAGVDDAPGLQEASALIAGQVIQARLLVNPVTEEPYWWVRVQTRGVVLHALADRDTLGGDPRPGNVLLGSFWLVGRTV
jgi:hypothetical protein